MRQPPGFKDTTHPSYVCKLNKAIYGLKQSPRQWFSTLSAYLQHLGFIQSQADHSLHIFRLHNTVIYFLVYVDDILMTGNNPSKISQVIQQLQSRFNMKVLGQLSTFLGIQTSKIKGGVLLHQQSYLTQLLHNAGMTDFRSTPTPATLKPTSKSDDSQPYEILHTFDN